MEFSELVKSVGEKLPDVKDLTVSVEAKRDEKGEWKLRFKADSLYMGGAGISSNNPEGLVAKIVADKLPALKLDSVGRITPVVEKQTAETESA